MRTLPHAILLGLIATAAAARADHPSPYLYIWMGDKDGQSDDFLAVYDANPRSATYNQFMTTVPVGLKGSMPHHLQYELPPRGDYLFANAHHLEKLLMFDFSDAAHPRLARVLDPPAPFRYPHDVVRLPNGHLLVGYLRSEGASPLAGDEDVPGGHGGIAELDKEGKVLRTASAADPDTRRPIRPYTFAVLPKIDRMVTTSARMMENASADVVQVWRFSDFKLLKTFSMPPALLPNGKPLMTGGSRGQLYESGDLIPFEPRVMKDGSVLLNAYGCGFYRLTEIASDTPKLTNVYTIEVPQEVDIGGCAVPALLGHYWIMPVGDAHMVVTLDIADPAHPREVARLMADQGFVPHWLAKDPGTNRYIVGQEMEHEDRMLMMRVDERTGRLWWDETVRSSDGTLGITFKRSRWPHGDSGEATGHAALFAH